MLCQGKSSTGKSSILLFIIEKIIKIGLNFHCLESVRGGKHV